MAKFIALTSKGLGPILKSEMDELGLKVVKAGNSSVIFEGPWRDCYLANWMLRTATRVALPVLDFSAYNYDELYSNIIKKHDFTKYLDLSQTFAIEATTQESALRDQRMIAMKIKDAIADQFRKKCNDQRPSVDPRNPDVRILARVVKNQVSVSIDTSGRALSFRGYREEQGVAPLREHLAAGLILLSGWKGESVLADPFCGAGTLLIEAALIQQQRSPQKPDRKFAFEALKNFQSDVAQEVYQQVWAKKEKPQKPVVNLFGSDKDSRVIDMAKRNARRAGVEKLIQFETTPLSRWTAPAELGILVTNPPYGERLEDLERAQDLFVEMGQVLKQEAGNWDFWVLCGQSELTKMLKMKATLKVPLMNGPLECRFLHYKILPKKDKV